MAHRPASPQRRPEPALPRDESHERRSSEPQPPTVRDSWNDDLPPRRPVGEATAERPARSGREETPDSRGEGESRGRRRRGRRGGRGRRRDDDRPLESGGETGSFDREGREPEDVRSREPRDFDRELDRSTEGREPRPTRRADESRSRTRSRDDEPSRESRRRPMGENGFDRGGDDVDRERPLAECDELEERRSPAAEGEGTDDDHRPRKRRRRGRRGGRSRPRTGGETATGSDVGREPGSGDADDEPLPASYGSRTTPRSESALRTEESRGGGDEQPSAEGSGGEASSRGRGRRRRRRGESRTGTDAQRKTGTGERRESARSRSGESRRVRGSEPRSSRSRGRRDDFAPVSGRFDEDDEGLEFLGVEEAVREATPRSRPAEDDDVLTESGLNTVLDVPSWVEAIGIVIAGNLTARSSRSGRSEGGSPPSRGR